LQHLARRGWLLISLCAGQERLATLVPISPSFVFRSPRRASNRPYVLSRFAYLRSDGATLVLESPLAFSRLLLHDARAVALVHALIRPTSAGELGGRVAGLSKEATAELLALFAAASMVAEVGEAGATAEDENPALKTWEFHDLLFHARSRLGRHDAPVGGTYQHAGDMRPPRALKPSAPEGVELFRPDLERLTRDDPPLADVQERRRSLREYADEPITARQLGEFLFRVARVKECREWEVSTPGGPVRMQGATRPYPAGGGLYELEVYAVVNRCRGLDDGLYQYDALGHRLGRLAGRTGEVEALLSDAASAAVVAPEALQVLLILASRFPRLAWKYASLAYALTLKHVGVVYQTMYLAATAMGLAPCALGAGNSDLFARAAGVRYYEETSVGEFLLGSKR
jgi:SagB-type dehydrogenase family enzyme